MTNGNTGTVPVYAQTEQRVVELRQRSIICTSPGQGYEVIGTGEPNLPAGVREFYDTDWDDWFE